MISADYAIHRFRRDVTLSAFVRIALGIAAAACLLAAPLLKTKFDPSLLLFGIGAVWLVGTWVAFTRYHRATFPVMPEI